MMLFKEYKHKVVRNSTMYIRNSTMYARNNETTESWICNEMYWPKFSQNE